ncbi:MAG: 23S rRNA (adenine(2503)-C(2))-methyltransferase RlmN [Clostridiales bacterium]|nr:23S rRNA (adenine(2503)-C(2))-methyltransferase RlmN [Clostridiales bacterium]
MTERLQGGKVQLLSLNEEEMSAFIQRYGQPSYRGKQIFERLHRGARFAEMTNLPLSLRTRLEEECLDQPVSIQETFQSRIDDTVKFLYRLSDGHTIEGVLMRYKYGYTLCLSTQVGCRMGCAFCASTLEGCARNLTAGEMLGQITAVNRWMSEKKMDACVGNLVLMGSGEPLDNYEETVRFLRLLREPSGIQIGLRGVSLSTCGLVPEMRRFAGEGLPVTLSISLHAPNDTIRRKIMPVSHRYSIGEVLGAARYYLEKTGRRIIIEYALIHGINASVQDARELSGVLRGMQCHVNLIPLNSVPERGLRGVSEDEVRSFLHTLEENGISATRRREMGDDINGACGQLRRDYLKCETDDTRKG